MKKKNGLFLKILIVSGILLFAVIAVVVVKSTATVAAIVPNQEISAGTKVEDSMIHTIRVPVDTPKGYITDSSSIVGQKLKTSVAENQLLYINNFMSSWDDFSSNYDIPKDYVVTSIQLPSNRAVGGLITPGDVVDILGIPNSTYQDVSNESMRNFLGNIAENNYGEEGINLYWVLANVKILETDSTLAQESKSSIANVTQDDPSVGNNGSFYIVALSYDDYKKLRLSEQYLDFWMNIAPTISEDRGPLLDQMNDKIITELKDAQTQSAVKLVDKDEAKKEGEKEKNSEETLTTESNNPINDSSLPEEPTTESSDGDISKPEGSEATSNLPQE